MPRTSFGSRHCINCLKEFEMRHQSQMYCTPRCRVEYNSPSIRSKNSEIDNLLDEISRPTTESKPI